MPFSQQWTMRPARATSWAWMLYVKLANDRHRAPANVPGLSPGTPRFRRIRRPEIKFYDEAQFEAYRALGECAIASLFRRGRSPETRRRPRCATGSRHWRVISCQIMTRHFKERRKPFPLTVPSISCERSSSRFPRSCFASHGLRRRRATGLIPTSFSSWPTISVLRPRLLRLGDSDRRISTGSPRTACASRNSTTPRAAGLRAPRCVTGYYAQQVRRDTVPGVPSGGRGVRPVWARALAGVAPRAGLPVVSFGQSGMWTDAGRGRFRPFVLCGDFEPDTSVRRSFTRTNKKAAGGRAGERILHHHGDRRPRDQVPQGARGEIRRPAVFFQYIASTRRTSRCSPAEDIARYSATYHAGGT